MQMTHAASSYHLALCESVFFFILVPSSGLVSSEPVSKGRVAEVKTSMSNFIFSVEFKVVVVFIP